MIHKYEWSSTHHDRIIYLHKDSIVETFGKIYSLPVLGVRRCCKQLPSCQSSDLRTFNTFVIVGEYKLFQTFLISTNMKVDKSAWGEIEICKKITPYLRIAILVSNWLIACIYDDFTWYFCLQRKKIQHSLRNLWMCLSISSWVCRNRALQQ